jgi:hypothetical protein
MRRFLFTVGVLAFLGGCQNAQENVDANSPEGAFKLFDGSGQWQEPQDSAAAINTPDEYAWRLFIALNWPADVAKREPDPTKKLGEQGPVYWETWANAPDIFLPNGNDPGPWLSVGGKSAVAGETRDVSEFDLLPIQQQIRLETEGEISILFDPDAAEAQVNETRMNKPAYEFIRSKSLYNLDGQRALAASGARTVQFPLEAKEVKAQWREIAEVEKPRYHWAELGFPDGSKKIYGLTALHITTKDLPNWLWATFEHVDNPSREGNEPWLLPSHDTFACKGKQPDCNEAPKGIGLEGTPWEHYRLRGTQIDFTDSRGKPTLLANSQPEEGFQPSSSCITCHARASVNANGARLSIFKPGSNPVVGDVGPVDPAWFESNGASKFTQLDFVWSMRRARQKTGS